MLEELYPSNQRKSSLRDGLSRRHRNWLAVLPSSGTLVGQNALSVVLHAFVVLMNRIITPSTAPLLPTSDPPVSWSGFVRLYMLYAA